MLHGVRMRVTAVATLVVVVVLTITAVVLVRSQRNTLTATIDETLERHADELVVRQEAGTLTGTIVPSGDEDSFAQVATRDGRVVAATSNVAGAPLLLTLPPGRTSMFRSVRLDSTNETSRVFVRAAGDHVVLSAAPLDDVEESVATLRRALLVAIPLVAAALALLSWWLVGRTLGSVEAIRARVSHITATNLHERVPVPPTADEIARLAETMNAMLERLDTAAERQRRFVADASHELRSPLARMRSELEVDARDPAAADLEATQRSILDETIALQRLVDDLLQLARSDASDAPPRRDPVDLDDIVLRQAEQLRADRRVRVDLSGVSAAQVAGDREQLARAVRNLSENATRHAQSTVWFRVRETDGRAEVVVSDDGPGIPPDQREAIFERFTRVDTARRGVDGGTGLGLAIARDIAERHGGTLSVDPDGGPGASFVLSIPVAARHHLA
jgi:signal transduction histidine kinase